MEPLVRRLPPDAALETHTRQLRGTVVLGGLSLVVLVSCITALVVVGHTGFIWPALLGAVGLIASLVRRRGLLLRRDPPTYEVSVDRDGITGTWAGQPPVRISWREVRQLTEAKGGFVVVGKGTAVVPVPPQIPEVGKVRAEVDLWRGTVG